ncbi:23S rRNA (uridine(2479)-2'-O)-methyltransferase [compost metagenome]
MEILSPQNARVKEWASLLEKKHRDQKKKYIVEGIHLVQEAIKNDTVIECVCYDIDAGIPAELVPLSGSRLDVQWIAVSSAVITKCTEVKAPQPIFAVSHKANANEHEDTLQGLIAKRNSLVLVLDGVQDPGNVGTLIRSADAVGADGVILGAGCADLYSPKVIRSTMGSIFHLPVLQGNLGEVLPQAKEQGIRLAGTSLQAAVNCYSYDFTQSVWLLMGSEAKGLSDEVLSLMDAGLIIPMHGQSESLNVAMAGSVLLYEALRQRAYSNR